MILECPACRARYRLADDAIPATGKNVRCAKCKHGWFEAGAVAPAAPVAPVAPVALELPMADTAPPPPAPLVPEVEPEDDAAPEPLPRVHWLWSVLAVVIGLALTAAALLVENPALPPLDLTRVPVIGDRLDAVVNPPAPPPVPLTLRANVEFRPLPGGRMLVLTGSVANPTGIAQAVPAIEAILLDNARTPVFRWRIAAPVATLPPGRSAAFDSSTFGTPPAGSTVTLRFAATP